MCKFVHESANLIAETPEFQMHIVDGKQQQPYLCYCRYNNRLYIDLTIVSPSRVLGTQRFTLFNSLLLGAQTDAFWLPVYS